MKNIFKNLLYTLPIVAFCFVFTFCESKMEDEFGMLDIENPKSATITSYGPEVTIQGYNGLYVSSENGDKGMICDRIYPGSWEKFTIVNLSNGKKAFKGVSKWGYRYVSSENGDKNMYCTRESVGAWEEFTLKYEGRDAANHKLYSIKGESKWGQRYVSAEGWTNNTDCDESLANDPVQYALSCSSTPEMKRMYCTREVASTWEKFIIRVGSSDYNL